MAVRQLGVLTLDLIAQTSKFMQGMGSARKATKTASDGISGDMARIDRSVQQTQNSMVNFRSVLMGLGAGLSIAGLKNTLDDYTNLQNRLKLVTDSQEELAYAMNATFQVARAATIEWSSAADIYSKIAANSEKFKLTQEEMADVTKTLANAISISGVSSDDATRSLIQFGQALSIGVLRGQDLRSVMSQTPGILKAITIGLGKTTGELLKMSAAGELTNEVVLGALQKAAPEIQKMYDETATSISGASTAISNSFTKWIGEQNEAAGAGKALVNVMLSVADNFDTIATILGVAAVAGVSKFFVSQVTGVMASINATRMAIDQKRQDIIVEKQRQATIAQSTFSQVRLSVAHLEQERNLLAAQIRTSTSIRHRIELSGQLTAVNIRLAATERQLTAATQANALAQTAATQAQAARTAGMAGMAATAGRAALTLVGGWVGLGITLATVAGAYLLTRDRASETTKTLKEQQVALKDINEVMKSMTASQMQVQLKVEQDSLKETEKQLDDARKRISSVINKIPLPFTGSDSDESRRRLQALLKEYNYFRGSLTDVGKRAEDFGEKLLKIDGLSQKTKDSVIAQIAAVSGLSKEYIEQKGRTDAVSEATKNAKTESDGMTQAMKDQESAIKAAAEAYSEYVAKFEERKASAEYTNKLLKENINISKEELSLYQDWAKDYGFNAPQMQTEIAQKDLAARKELLSLEQQNNDILDKREEIRKKEEEANKKRLDYAKNNYKYSQAEYKMLERVAKIANENDFSGIESRRGIPSGLLSAIVAQESKGNANAVSHTGAIGLFQTTSVYRKQMKLSAEESVKDVRKTAEAAAKYLSDAYKELGSWEKAITAYNAGVTGSKNFYAGTSSATGDRLKEISSYAKMVNKWWQGGQGRTAIESDLTTDDPEKRHKQIVDFIMAQAAAEKKRLEDQKELQKQYMDDEARRLAEHQERLKNISETYIDNPAETKRLQDIEKERFKTSEEALKEQQRKEIDGWKWVGIERIRQERNVSIAVLKARTDLNDASMADAVKSIEDQAQREIDAYNKTQSDAVKNIRKDIEKSSQEIARARQDAMNRISMTSIEYESFRISQGRDTDADTAKKELEAYQEKINAKDQYDVYVIESEIERNNLLLQAEEDYQQKLLGIKEKYDEEDRALREKTKIESLKSYEALFSGIGGLLGAYAENSKKTYLGVIALERAAGLAQVYIQSQVAISKAWASASFPYNLPAVAAATIETGALQATLKAFMPIGMSHSGLDYIPSEGTWLLDKGERVLSAQQNADLTSYLETYKSNGNIGQGGVGGNSIRIINTLNDENIANSMNSTPGETVIMNTIQRNANEIRGYLGV